MTTDQNHWEPCSPAWLAAMPEGACAWAPRRAGDGRTVSHYHPAAPVRPPADQTALRDRIADALYRHEWPGKQVWVQALAMDREVFEAMADAVLAALPEQTDRAAVLREAADTVFALEFHKCGRTNTDFVSFEHAWDLGTIDAANKLRRVAAEEQPAEAQGCCGKPAGAICVHDVIPTTSAVGEQPETQEARHLGGRANAEDCPACEGTNPPYPFLCPGPDAP